VARQELLLLQAMQLHLNQPALFQRFELLRQWRKQQMLPLPHVPLAS